MESEVLKAVANLGMGAVALVIGFYIFRELMSFLKNFVTELHNIAVSIQSLADKVVNEKENNIQRQESIITKLDVISRQFEQQVSRCKAVSLYKQ
jgi:divalent metal cation (Fe/Co/Zn/Cd) transporter